MFIVYFLLFSLTTYLGQVANAKEIKHLQDY